MSDASDLRPLLWVASSKRDFIEMPEDVVGDFGHWLFQVQKGKTPGLETFEWIWRSSGYRAS